MDAILKAGSFMEKKNMYKGWFIAMTIAMFAFLALFIVYAVNYGSAIKERDDLMHGPHRRAIYNETLDGPLLSNLQWVGTGNCAPCMNACPGNKEECYYMCYSADPEKGPGPLGAGCWESFIHTMDGFCDSSVHCDTTSPKAWPGCSPTTETTNHFCWCPDKPSTGGCYDVDLATLKTLM